MGQNQESVQSKQQSRRLIRESKSIAKTESDLAQKGRQTGFK